MPDLSNIEHPSRALASRVIAIFEDILNDHGIQIPNGERDEGDVDKEDQAAIFGSDYYSLEDKITNIIYEETKHGGS